MNAQVEIPALNPALLDSMHHEQEWLVALCALLASGALRRKWMIHSLAPWGTFARSALPTIQFLVQQAASIRSKVSLAKSSVACVPLEQCAQAPAFHPRMKRAMQATFA